MNIVTTDLSNYGYRELSEAGKLLQAFGDNGADFLNDGISLNFNTHSGIVFLSDEDMNVGILEENENPIENKIVQFFSCPNCGNEGTDSNVDGEGYEFKEYNGYCSEACEDAV